MKRLLSIARVVGAGTGALFDALLTPAAVVLLLMALGCAASVFGVFLLFGSAWSLIAGAVLMFALAGIIARGLNG